MNHVLGALQPRARKSWVHRLPGGVGRVQRRSKTDSGHHCQDSPGSDTSWLNIAEIELSALIRQCLDRRIDDIDILNAELAAWQSATNADQRQVQWQFTTSDARTRLRGCPEFRGTWVAAR
ncbi:MAG: hypothetical protein ACYC1E_15205 [Propionibacteriaceae bacterium]